MEMKTAVVVGYGRSACCRARKGGLAQTHPVDFAAQTLRGILDQIPNLRSEQIEDVILGCAMPVKQMDFNPARLVVQRAGLPESVCGVSINRYCSSGLQAIAYASDAIRAGRSTCIVAGGAESMSMCFAPYPEEYWEPFLKEHSAGAYITVGETAERVAEQYGITRAEMDRAAVESHRRAAKARADGKLAPSIIPVVNASGETIDRDDGIREGCTMESLASLRPCFRPDGLVTAGTSSQTTDAAAFVVLMEEQAALAQGIKPIARLIDYVVQGCDPTLMGLGPIYAVPKLLERCGLSLDDMDVIELNEAFASQMIACIRTLKLPEELVNPYGGAMALGHPMGATGAILTCKALDYLRENNGRYGLITMCIGGGMGAAGIYELLT